MKNPPLTIGIIGLGMVGAPIKRYFEEKGHTRGKNLFLLDPAKKLADDIGKADVIFIAVPTPRTASGAADTSIVFSVVENIPAGKIVVIKSTVPPGTTEKVQRENPKLNVLFSPEFLTEKNAWNDFLHPDRQIVGFTKKSKKIKTSSCER